MINMVDNEKSTWGKLMSGSLLLMVLTHMLVHAAGNMRTTLFPVLKEEFAPASVNSSSVFPAGWSLTGLAPRS